MKRRNHESLLREALHNIRIDELASEYRKRGWNVDVEPSIGGETFDLFVRSPDEKERIVIEVKTAPISREIAQRMDTYREQFRKENIKFRLVTVQPPQEKRIDILWLDEALLRRLSEKQPNAIESKASHVLYEEVSTEILEIEIDNNSEANVKLSGTLSVELQYGSNSDVQGNEGAEFSTSFPLRGSLKLSLTDCSILEDSIEIDDSDWYDESV